MIDRPQKTTPSDLSYPPTFGLSFDDFTNPIDLTNQSYTPIGGSETAFAPQRCAGLIVLKNLSETATEVFTFVLGIGNNVPMTIVLQPNETLSLRGAWSSIQSGVGGGEEGGEAHVFWYSDG